EDGRAPAVVDEQRRERADERRLARPVLAEDGHARAPPERERHPVERPDARARTALAAGELLCETDDFDCVLHGCSSNDDVNRARTDRPRRGSGMAGGGLSPGVEL